MQSGQRSCRIAALLCILGSTLIACTSASTQQLGQTWREGSPRWKPPADFTPEERVQFTEASDKFSKKVMPRFTESVSNHPGWLDNRRVLLSVRALPDGWKAGDEERSRIVILNTETGAIEDTSYRGELLCYSPERIVIQDDWQATSDKFLVGKLGESLQPLSWPKAHRLIPSTCSLEPGKKMVGEKIVSDQPLRSSHPTIRVYLKPFDFHQEPGYWLVDKQENILNYIKPEQGSVPLSSETFYLPWLDAHIATAAYNFGTQIIQRDGAVTLYRVPEMLRRWADLYVASGRGFMTRKGMVWESFTMTGYYRKQGLYLQLSDNHLLRIEDHAVNNQWANVSPDGCKLLYGRVAGDKTRLITLEAVARNFQHVVLNICEGEEK